MKAIHSASALVTALLVSGPPLEAQNVVVNGSFEQLVGFGYNSNIGAGLEGWTIGNGGGVDIVHSTGFEPLYWRAATGDISLSLNFFGRDSVSQQLVTTPGVHYEIGFAMAAEVYGGPAQRTMDVLWNGAVVGSPTFDYTGQGPTTMGWVRFAYDVVGTGSDALTFSSTTDSNYGPALDDVSVVLAPEPNTASLVVLGAVSLVFVRARKRRA